MKKEYFAPDFKVVSVLFQDALAASTYVPDPQDPTREGSTEEFDDF